MRLLVFLISLSMSFSLWANEVVEFFERPDFVFNQGNLSLRPGVSPSTYNIGAKAPVTNPKSGWTDLDRSQVVTNQRGRTPYRLEIHSSTKNGNYIIMEGGASSGNNGEGQSELVVTDIHNKQIRARTRCQAKHTTVEESNNPLGNVVNLNFNLFGQDFSTRTKKDHRELLDCTTVTPKFCQDVLKGVSHTQFKSCMEGLKNIAKANPNDWRTLKAREKNLADTWTMPFAENFFNNVNNNSRGQTKAFDYKTLEKYTSFTGTDEKTLLNLYKDCDIFRFNKPITNPTISPLAGTRTTGEESSL